MAVRIKFCGLTRMEDADAAVEAGAWALGVNLWPGSARATTVDFAAEVAARYRRRVEVCGIFVNAPLDEVAASVEASAMTMVQLHGDEGPSYCQEVARRTGAKIVKAGRIREAADLQAMRPFHTDFHLLDTRVDGLYGGTGEQWDYALLRHRRSEVPVIVSGGLTAENVGVAIAAARPYAVDVAGGIESAPGVKDAALIGAFADAVLASDKAFPETQVEAL